MHKANKQAEASNDVDTTDEETISPNSAPTVGEPQPGSSRNPDVRAPAPIAEVVLPRINEPARQVFMPQRRNNEQRGRAPTVGEPQPGSSRNPDSIAPAPTVGEPQPGSSRNPDVIATAPIAEVVLPRINEPARQGFMPQRRNNEHYEQRGRLCPACKIVCRSYNVTRLDTVFICVNSACWYPYGYTSRSLSPRSKTEDMDLAHILVEFPLQDTVLLENFIFYVRQLEVSEGAPLLLTRRDWAEHMVLYTQAYCSNEGASAA